MYGIYSNIFQQKTSVLIDRGLSLLMSGWQDSNLRPPHPKCGAIPGYATPRLRYFIVTE